MPTNVTPEYERAERRFREAGSDTEKLDALREMLSTVPKHKGTEKLQADIKRRISQLRKAEAKKPAGRGADPYHVPRGGAGQVLLVGTPNVGKSRLVAATTNAPVKVADYPFATPVPVPGMWPYEDVQVQIIDTPPVTADHVPGGLLSAVRLADIVCIVADASADPLGDADTVLGLLAERGYTVETLPCRELDLAERRRRSGLIVAAKADLAAPGTIETLRELYEGRLDVCPVSAATGQGLDTLRDRLWDLLGVIRIYTKQPGEPADMEKPFTIPLGSTVEDLAREIHRELPEKMKYARIWGHGRFDGQHVHRTEELRDKDVIEIHE
ncbi:MAG TPA: GTPase [Phycisphaerae bacterium]|nr:GTPase [Phycisphaerae bacterium]